MENGKGAAGVANGSGARWNFAPRPKGKDEGAGSGMVTVREVLNMILSKVDPADTRQVVFLGHGDPSAFPCFRIDTAAEDAVEAALRSGKYNGYSSTVGIPPARKAVANYLSKDLPYELSPDDVFLTAGCTQAIELLMSVLARPGANILLPKPGFPYYEVRCDLAGMEVRHFDLLPDRGWEVDLESLEAMADGNTVAMVIINPGNPCGNVFTYEHLAKVAETARRLGIMVISDEVYHHLAFGSNPFVPMGVFGGTVPVLTLGSISKRWVVPGWRLGWIVTSDPKGILKETKIVDGMIAILNASTDPVTFVQGAVPQIIESTKEDFFNKTINLLKQAADLSYDKIQEIGCLVCPQKPDGSMFVMVKLNLSDLEGILDDVDFCCKLAKEESVIILPGVTVGARNWLRITFAIEPSVLADGLKRLKSFCQRHGRLDKSRKDV